jgi:hypothetical protein
MPPQDSYSAPGAASGAPKVDTAPSAPTQYVTLTVTEVSPLYLLHLFEVTNVRIEGFMFQHCRDRA